MLVGSMLRDTANESRDDGSWWNDVEFYTHQLSVQSGLYLIGKKEELF